MLYKVTYTEKPNNKLEVRIEKNKKSPTLMDPPPHSVPKLIDMGADQVSLDDLSAVENSQQMKEFTAFIDKEIVKNTPAQASNTLFRAPNNGFFSLG